MKSNQIKRFAWLLVLPYVVTDSYTFEGRLSYHVGMSTSSYFIVPDKEVAFDLADALNQAHARRLSNQPSKKKIGFDTSTDDFSGKKP